MQGFRPGKVPLTVLKKRYGGQLMGEVLGSTVQETSQEAIKILFKYNIFLLPMKVKFDMYQFTEWSVL